jgi:hypothetical protein
MPVFNRCSGIPPFRSSKTDIVVHQRLRELSAEALFHKLLVGFVILAMKGV